MFCVRQCQEIYVARKEKRTKPTPFAIGPECVGMWAKVGETPGTIRYVGRNPVDHGTWIGVELDTPTTGKRLSVASQIPNHAHLGTIRGTSKLISTLRHGAR